MFKNSLEKWIFRIENDLKIQKDIQQEIMIERYTRKDLIELRLFLDTLNDLLLKKDCTTLRFPCEIGQTLYLTPTYENGRTEIERYKVVGFLCDGLGATVNMMRTQQGKSNLGYQAGVDMFGESVFYSLEEAQKHYKG